MILLAKRTDETIEIVGHAAEDGETLTCEGCSDQVDELFEDDGMNLLCRKCISLS